MANIFSIVVGRGAFDDGRARLYVRFAETKQLRDAGQVGFEWTPEWGKRDEAEKWPRGVLKLVQEAARVEAENNPINRSWFYEFGNVVVDIIREHALKDEMKIVHGRMVAYKDSKVTVAWQERDGFRNLMDVEEKYEIVDAVSKELLNKIATSGETFRWIVWDGKITDIIHLGDEGDDRHRSVITGAETKFTFD